MRGGGGGGGERGEVPREVTANDFRLYVYVASKYLLLLYPMQAGCLFIKGRESFVVKSGLVTKVLSRTDG